MRGVLRRSLPWVGLLLLLPFVVVLSATGATETSVALTSGQVWLGSPGEGLATLVDGPSNALIAIARGPWTPGSDLAFTQLGTSAIIADDAAGTLTRLDGATLAVSAPVRFAGPAAGLTVLTAGGRVYAIDAAGARASAIDPKTLNLLDSPFPMAAHPGPGQSLVDQTGRLWIVDQDGSGLNWYDPDGSHGQAAAAPTDQLATVAGAPAVIETGIAQPPISWLDDDGDRSTWDCHLQTPLGADPRLLGSTSGPQLFATVPATGSLVSAADSGDCGTTAEIGSPGDAFGEMAQSGHYLFVANETAGQIKVIDLQHPDVVAQSLALTEPGHHVEMVAKDGLAFYNDLDSQLCGVLTLDGGTWAAGPAIQKYDPGDPKADITAPTVDPVEPTVQTQPRGDPSTTPTTDAASPPSTAIPNRTSATTVTGTTPGLPTQAVTSRRGVNDGGTATRGGGGGTSVAGTGLGGASASGSSSGVASSSSGSTTPISPARQQLVVTGIAIASAHGTLDDGSYNAGDTLTFTPTVTGGTPKTYSWALNVLGDSTPQGTSVEPVPSFVVHYGGGTEDFVITLKVGNDDGDSQPKGTQFRVSYTHPLVTGVALSPNPVEPGGDVSVNPTIEGGPYQSCTWSLDGHSADCSRTLSAPAAPGDYIAEVSVLSLFGIPFNGTATLHVQRDCSGVLTAMRAVPSDQAAGQPVQLTVDGDPSPLSSVYTWDIVPADPQFQSSQSQSNTWTPTSPGSYTISASAFSPSSGCFPTNTVSTTVTVRRAPDRSPPIFGTPDITEGVRSGSVTIGASDPESGIAAMTLTVQFVWVDQCTARERPNAPAPVSGVRTGDSITASYSASTSGFCIDPTDPNKQKQNDELVVKSWSATATNGDGLTATTSG